MRFIPLIFLFVLSNNVTAQKKLLIDLGVGILYPIGSDNLKTYNSTINPLTVNYHSREKLQYPSVNILGDIAYPLTKKLAIGIQTGVYLRFKERYTTYTQGSLIFIPLQITGKYNLFKINEKWFGLNMAAGILLFDFTDVLERFHNSATYNVSLSYPLSKKGLIKAGIENQIDNVSFNAGKLNPNFVTEIFDYKLNRLFASISYVFIIKQ